MQLGMSVATNCYTGGPGGVGDGYCKHFQVEHMLHCAYLFRRCEPFIFCVLAYHVSRRAILRVQQHDRHAATAPNRTKGATVTLPYVSVCFDVSVCLLTAGLIREAEGGNGPRLPVVHYCSPEQRIPARAAADVH